MNPVITLRSIPAFIEDKHELIVTDAGVKSKSRNKIVFLS